MGDQVNCGRQAYCAIYNQEHILFVSYLFPFGDKKQMYIRARSQAYRFHGRRRAGKPDVSLLKSDKKECVTNELSNIFTTQHVFYQVYSSLRPILAIVFLDPLFVCSFTAYHHVPLLGYIVILLCCVGVPLCIFTTSPFFYPFIISPLQNIFSRDIQVNHLCGTFYFICHLV